MTIDVPEKHQISSHPVKLESGEKDIPVGSPVDHSGPKHGIPEASSLDLMDYWAISSRGVINQSVRRETIIQAVLSSFEYFSLKILP